MPALVITGTIQDNQGNSVPFGATANQSPPQDVITVGNPTVTPDPAPAGTMRTLFVPCSSSLGLDLTGTVTAPGTTFTPVSPNPVGGLAWTFTF